MDWVNVVRAHHSARDVTSGHTVSLSRNLVQLANLGPGWRIGPRAWDRRPLHIRIFQESQNLNAWGRDGWNVKPHALLVFMMHYAFITWPPLANRTGMISDTGVRLFSVNTMRWVRSKGNWLFETVDWMNPFSFHNTLTLQYRTAFSALSWTYKH